MPQLIIQPFRCFSYVTAHSPTFPATSPMPQLILQSFPVDPGGPVVIILATESEVRGFKPGRGRWILSERKIPEYDFLRKGSKAVGPMS